MGFGLSSWLCFDLFRLLSVVGFGMGVAGSGACNFLIMLGVAGSGVGVAGFRASVFAARLWVFWWLCVRL
jgi:hypothetical protein